MEALDKCIRPSKLALEKDRLEQNLLSWNLLIEAIDDRTERLIDEILVGSPESGSRAVKHIRSKYMR